MTTGRKAASSAGRELAKKSSTPSEKRVAASDLSQAKRQSGRRSSSARATRRSGR